MLPVLCRCLVWAIWSSEALYIAPKFPRFRNWDSSFSASKCSDSYWRGGSRTMLLSSRSSPTSWWSESPAPWLGPPHCCCIYRWRLPKYSFHKKIQRNSHCVYRRKQQTVKEVSGCWWVPFRLLAQPHPCVQSHICLVKFWEHVNFHVGNRFQEKYGLFFARIMLLYQLFVKNTEVFKCQCPWLARIEIFAENRNCSFVLGTKHVKPRH